MYLPLMREGSIDPFKMQDLNRVHILLVFNAGRDERHIDVCLDTFDTSAGSIPVPLLVILVLGPGTQARSPAPQASGGLFFLIAR